MLGHALEKHLLNASACRKQGTPVSSWKEPVEILGPFYWSPSGTESAKYCQVYGDISEFEEAVSQSEYSSVFHRLKKWY